MKFKIWALCLVAFIAILAPQVSSNVIALKLAIVTMICYIFYYK